MPHGDTVVDGYRIKLRGVAAHLLNLLPHNLSDLMQMGMTWYKLRKRVDNGNNRLAKLLMLHTRSHPKGTGTCHSTAFRAYRTSQLMLVFHIIKYLFS